MSSRLPDNSIDSIWRRSHLAELLLLALACSLLFVKLGIGEYESWDESHIVYRAHVVEEYGAWLDQSPYALGGLYSSSHPPLGVWLMVASRAMLGESEFATRLPAALCGLFAVIGIVLLIRRWVSDPMALLLATVFACGSNFLWYSRHAQLDSLLLCTSVWTAVLYLRALDRATVPSALIAGLSLGLALLSKFGWGSYILPFVLGITIISTEPRRWRQFIIFGLAGAMIGSSWMVYMLLTNVAFADSIVHWLTGLSTDAAYEGSDQGYAYYINQVIIACPLLVLGCRLFRHERDKQSFVGAAWLASVMIVLQLAATKFPHFGLMLLPPAFVLSALLLRRREQLTRLEQAALGIAVFWSLSTQLRLLLRGHEFELLMPDVTALGAAIVAVVAILTIHRRLAEKKHYALLGLVSLVFVAAATRIWGYNESTFADGAEQIAELLSHRRDITEVVVVHSGLPHDSLTPRLALYTKGMTSNWIEGKRTTKGAWTDDTLVQWFARNADANTAVILSREIDRFNRPSVAFTRRYDSVVALMQTRFQKRDSLRSYDFFID